MPPKTEAPPESTETTAGETCAPPGRTGTLAKWLVGIERLLRCVAIAFIAWLGWSTASALLVFTRPAPAPPAPAVVEGEAALSPLAEVLDGNWEFADFPWRIALRKGPASEIEAWLATPPQPTGGTRSPEADDGLHELLVSLGALPGEQAGRKVLAIRGEGLRAIGWLADNGSPASLAMVRAAWPEGTSGEWNLLEAQPVNETNSAGEAVGLSGAPLPAGTTLLAKRRSAQGTTLAELLSCERGAEAFAAHLQEHGWTVERQSGDQDMQPGWLASRGQQRVQVLATAAAGEGEGAVVMILRLN